MDLLVNDKNRLNDTFTDCEDLVTINLVGGIHEAVSYLPFESWRNNEMNTEINRNNHLLPTTEVIQQWIESVLERINHFKAEHRRLLEEATTQIELALWSVKIKAESVPDGDDGCKGQNVGSIVDRPP